MARDLINMGHGTMGRLNWDRLRRIRPLDGADVRVDPDGAHLWEREQEDAALPLGARRLRHGVIVRRRQERVAQEQAPPRTSAPAPNRAGAERGASGADASPHEERGKKAPLGPLRCRRCGARVSPRKLLRHVRRCPKREG